MFRVIFILVAIAAPNLARAQQPPSDVPIVATRVRPDHNAAQLAQACGAAVSSKHCPADPAVMFCHEPLELKLPVPTVDRLGHISQNECDRLTPLTPLAAATQDAPAKLGATWQEDILQGLVAFLVKRAKAEALASLIDRLQQDVCGDSIGAFVLASTCGLLDGADPYSDPIAWTVLRGAFQADLRSLPARVVQRTLGSEAAEPLIALAQIIPQLEAGQSPIELLVGLRIRYAPKVGATCKSAPVSCALLLVGETVEILDTEKPVKPADRATRDAITFRLVHDSLHEVGIDLPRPVDCNPERLCALSAELSVVEHLLVPLRDAASAAHGATDRKDLTETFRTYAEQMATTMAGAAVAIARARGLVVDPAGIGAAIVHLEQALRNARERDYVGALLELHAAFLNAGVKLPPWLSKYGGFMAELATAQGKAEVEQALEAAAAPVGAWRAKRGRGHHMLSLQGYVGVQGGLEWLGGDGAPPGTAGHGGLFVPVGLEVSFGFAHGWSAGVLFSAIDLGALVDARTSDAMTSNTSTLGFRQVFSPGAYAVLGLGSLPLSAGVGLSLSPELRSIDLGGGVSKDANALRLSAFLAIDIAIFEL